MLAISIDSVGRMLVNGREPLRAAAAGMRHRAPSRRTGDWALSASTASGAQQIVDALERDGKLPANLPVALREKMQQSLVRYFGEVSSDKIQQYADRASEVIKDTIRTMDEARGGGASAEVGLNPATARTSMTQFIEESVGGSIGVSIGGRMNMDFFLKVATEVVRGGMHFVADNWDQDTVDEFPACELLRVYDKFVPRGTEVVKGEVQEENGWDFRWSAACDEAGDDDALAVMEQTGRMVALKSSGVWQALGDGAGGYEDTLGNPFPPFAFNSGYRTHNVPRDEAVELGLMDEDDEAEGAKVDFESLFDMPEDLEARCATAAVARHALDAGAPLVNRNAAKDYRHQDVPKRKLHAEELGHEFHGNQWVHPGVVYHTYDSKHTSGYKSGTDIKHGGIFALGPETFKVGDKQFDPFDPNEYGDKVIALHLNEIPKDKIFTAANQMDATKKLFGVGEADKLDVALEKDLMMGYSQTDMKILSKLKRSGYWLVHYTDSEQYGSEYSVINKAAIHHIEDRNGIKSGFLGYIPGALQVIESPECTALLGGSTSRHAGRPWKLGVLASAASRAAARERSHRETISPLIADARVRAAAAAAGRGDVEEAESLLAGHGRYVGSCGHVLQQCRCAIPAGRKPHDTVAVDAPCAECKEQMRSLVAAAAEQCVAVEAEEAGHEFHGNQWTRNGTGISLKRSGDGKDSKWVTHSGEDIPEHAAKLGIPPAWKDVRVAPGPEHDLQAVGYDAKGREQRIYSDAFTQRQADLKFSRTSELIAKRDEVFRQNEANLSSEDPQTRENAACMKLVQQTGIRPGSDSDTGADKRAYGATTLEGRHVVSDEDGSVRLKFVGKKGVDLDIPVEDSATAKMLLERKAAAGDGGKLFGTDDAKLRDYSHTLDGGSYKPKDFRTLKGTQTAIAEAAAMPVPKTFKDYKKAVMAVAKKVAAKLGNTPAISLQSYIMPSVFAHWKEAVGA